MDVLHISHPLARGITLGAVATGVGTARALEEGEETGSAAATAMILTGLAVSVLAPLIVRGGYSAPIISPQPRSSPRSHASVVQRSRPGRGR